MTYTAAVASTDLDTTVDCVVGTLRLETHRDWTRPAGSVEWSCWQTAEHLGQVFAHYASQVAIHATTRYVRWSAHAQQPPDGVLDLLEATGRILALVVRASPDDLRVFHPYGIADPAAFAAGCCVEALIHGYDIASGLGVTFEPPEDVCERLLARLFAHHASEIAGVEPWHALRWATGRVELPHTPKLTSWKWRATPLHEEWMLTEPAPRPFA